MIVGKYMHYGAHTCPVDGSLADAARVMREASCGFLVAVDEDGRIAGVLTDRDVCLTAVEVPRALGDIPLRSATKDAVTVGEYDSLAHATDLMKENRVHRLPVLDPSRRPIGILSVSDIIDTTAPGAKAEGSAMSRESMVNLLVSIHR